jgi:hypothetical protein
MIVDGTLTIDPIYDLVKILNENGHQVVKIDNEFFIFTSFIPADRTTPYHTVIGKHITKILVDHYRTGMQNFLQVEGFIRSLVERDVTFSADTKWVKYQK